MGFLDGLAKTLTSAASSAASTVKQSGIDNMSKTWDDMKKMNGARVHEIYSDRKLNDTIGFMAFLYIVNREGEFSISLDQEERETAKRKGTSIKRLIDLSSGRNFDEIREAIKRLDNL